jgi:MoaA/NifB/PqqE/SkfB family radical SAM enzyme
MKPIFLNIQIKPIKACLEITNLCNLRCAHCYFFSRESLRNTPRDPLTFSEVKKMIKKFIKEGIFEIAIGGGEPFCFRGIEEILVLTTSKMYTCLTTNGLLLNDKRIDFLKQLPNLSLQISLDGTESTHKKIRGIDSKQFKKLDKIIKKCVANKINLRIGFMMCHLNIRDINFMHEYCKENKIKTLTILPYIGDNERLKLTPEDLQDAAKSLKKIKKEGDIEIQIRDPFLDSLINREKSICEAGLLTFNIDCYGNVSPCCYINCQIGNIFGLKIEDIPTFCNEKIEIKDRTKCPANSLY